MREKTANHKLEIKMNKHIKPLEQELMVKQNQKNLARLVGVIDFIRENYDTEFDMMVELLQDAGFNYTDASVIVQQKFFDPKLKRNLTFWKAKAELEMGRRIKRLDWHKSLKDCYLELLIANSHNESHADSSFLVLVYNDNGLSKIQPYTLTWEDLNSSNWVLVK